MLSYSQLEPISATKYRLSHYVDSYFLSANHKIGGYPYFIYKDIRTQDSSFYKYDTLLFQLILNNAQAMMWGDSGVISFFINFEKLKKQDFSDVLFYAEDY